METHFGQNIINWGGAYSIQETNDNGYIMVGLYCVLDCDIGIVKTDSLGNSGCFQIYGVVSVASVAAQMISKVIAVITPNAIVTNAPTIVGNCIVTVTDCAALGINEMENGNTFFVSPNPSLGNFIISFGNIIDTGQITLFNILGKCVFQENIFHESKKEINLQSIANGIYFVKVFDGEKSYCKKIIVEHD